MAEAKIVIQLTGDGQGGPKNAPAPGSQGTKSNSANAGSSTQSPPDDQDSDQGNGGAQGRVPSGRGLGRMSGSVNFRGLMNASASMRGGLVGMGIAAAAGPMANAVAQMVISRVEGLVTKPMQLLGDTAAATASLSPRASIQNSTEVAANIADAIGVPIIGNAMRTATAEVMKFTDALRSTSQRLAQYSPVLAASEANMEIAQILGDLRRARRLDGQLATFNQFYSAGSQNIQDQLAASLENLLAAVNGILKWIEGFATGADDPRVHMIVGAIDAAGGMNGAIMRTLRGIAETIKRKEEREDGEALLENLFGFDEQGVVGPNGPMRPRRALSPEEALMPVIDRLGGM